ncbi:MAG: phage head-tail connector protein [Oscillospiraceae bacterium]
MIDQALSTLSGLTDLDRAAILQILIGQDDRISKIKALLGITGDSQDHIIQFVAETVENMVLSYINQDALPAKLERVLVVMCVSYYKSAGLGSTQAATGPVSSVRRGMCKQALPPPLAPPDLRRPLIWAAKRMTFSGGVLP